MSFVKWGVGGCGLACLRAHMQEIGGLAARVDSQQRWTASSIGDGKVSKVKPFRIGTKARPLYVHIVT